VPSLPSDLIRGTDRLDAAGLLRECRRLRQVVEMVAAVEAEQKAVAQAEDGIAARLARLRGIGVTFAAVLGNEVFFRDFRNRREVGGYLGLAPSPWQSGGVRRDQGIAKSGNPRARRTAIELAGTAPPSLPPADRFAMALAAPSAWQRAHALVPRAGGCGQGAHAPDHAGRDGKEADRVLVALCGRRHRAGGRRAEGLNGFAAAATGLLATERDGRGPVAPRALMPSKRWVPLSRPRICPRTWDVGQAPSAGHRMQGGAVECRTGCSEADPDPVQQPAVARRRLRLTQ